MASAVPARRWLRLAVHRSVAIETSRGWRISKRTASHRIDLVVALAQAALGAVKCGIPGGLSPEDEADALGYAQEQREWQTAARRREVFDVCGPLFEPGFGRGRW